MTTYGWMYGLIDAPSPRVDPHGGSNEKSFGQINMSQASFLLNIFLTLPGPIK